MVNSENVCSTTVETAVNNINDLKCSSRLKPLLNSMTVIYKDKNVKAYEFRREICILCQNQLIDKVETFDFFDTKRDFMYIKRKGISYILKTTNGLIGEITDNENSRFDISSFILNNTDYNGVYYLEINDTNIAVFHCKKYSFAISSFPTYGSYFALDDLSLLNNAIRIENNCDLRSLRSVWVSYGCGLIIKSENTENTILCKSKTNKYTIGYSVPDGKNVVVDNNSGKVKEFTNSFKDKLEYKIIELYNMTKK